MTEFHANKGLQVNATTTQKAETRLIVLPISAHTDNNTSLQIAPLISKMRLPAVNAAGHSPSHTLFCRVLSCKCIKCCLVLGPPSPRGVSTDLSSPLWPDWKWISHSIHVIRWKPVPGGWPQSQENGEQTSVLQIPGHQALSGKQKDSRHAGVGHKSQINALCLVKFIFV